MIFYCIRIMYFLVYACLCIVHVFSANTLDVCENTDRLIGSRASGWLQTKIEPMSAKDQRKRH